MTAPIIEPGVLFSWDDAPRPALTVSNMPAGTVIHGGVFCSLRRPRRWWYLLTWYRAARRMWIYR